MSKKPPSKIKKSKKGKDKIKSPVTKNQTKSSSSTIKSQPTSQINSDTGTGSSKQKLIFPKVISLIDRQYEHTEKQMADFVQSIVKAKKDNKQKASKLEQKSKKQNKKEKVALKLKKKMKKNPKKKPPKLTLVKK